MLHQVRKRNPGASQQEIDAEMALAMAEDTELRRPAQPSATTLQQPAIDIEGAAVSPSSHWSHGGCSRRSP